MNWIPSKEEFESTFQKHVTQRHPTATISQGSDNNEHTGRRSVGVFAYLEKKFSIPRGPHCVFCGGRGGCRELLCIVRSSSETAMDISKFLRSPFSSAPLEDSTSGTTVGFRVIDIDWELPLAVVETAEERKPTYLSVSYAKMIRPGVPVYLLTGAFVLQKVYPDREPEVHLGLEQVEKFIQQHGGQAS